MKDILVYDCEIAKSIKKKSDLGDPYKLNLGSAVVYSYNKDRYYFYLHDNQKQNLINKLNGNICISFNGIQFDTKLLLDKNRKIFYYNKLFHVKQSNIEWREFDLFRFVLASFKKERNMTKCLKSISPGGLSLGALVKKNLKTEKIDKGENAPILYQKKKYDRLLEYNLQDVRITKQLFEFIKKNHFLVSGQNKRFKLNKFLIPATLKGE